MKRIAIALVCLLLFAGVGLYRLDRLNSIPVHTDNYSTYNLVEIYILGLVMSALAYPVYPEVATEHLSLYSQHKPQQHSDFFMQSSVVRNAIEKYSGPKVLTWPSSAYMIGNTEARVALALNGATLIKHGSVVRIEVPVRYPRNSLVKLLPFVEVQEGLFWVLQQRGWYHAGTMTWLHNLS